MLADVAELERGCRTGLSLECQVPLLIHRGLHFGSTNVHDSPKEWVPCDLTARTVLRLGCWIAVDRNHFGGSEWGIACEAQVRSSPFQVGGDGVCAAKDSFATPIRRGPSKADARLDIRQSVHRVIECAAIAILARVLEFSGDEIHVGLTIVQFNPGSIGFVAQPEIQGQSRRDAPVVLTVSSKSPGELVPRATRADTLARCPRIPGVEISCRVAGECSPKQ